MNFTFLDIKRLYIAVLSQSAVRVVFTTADFPSNSAVRFYFSQCYGPAGIIGECIANATGSEIACEIDGLKASTEYFFNAAACFLPGSQCGLPIDTFASTAPEGTI